MTGYLASRLPCRIAKLGAALLGLALASAGQAARFDSLYAITVSGDPAAADERADAERRAFAKLLTRVTGRQQAAAYPELAALLNSSARYLSYRPLRPLAGAGNRWRFEFNAVLVNQALNDLGLPVWGPERPATLLWLTVDFPDGNRAELALDSAGGARQPLIVERSCAGIGDEEPVYASNPLSPDELDWFEAVVGEILAACDERGLPLIVPRLDDEDRTRIQIPFAGAPGEPGRFIGPAAEPSASDDFTGPAADPFAPDRFIGRAALPYASDDSIERAAERYAPDALLIARVAASERPLVSWTHVRGERRQTVATESLRFGIDALADLYAAEYSIAGGARLTWITVRDIQSSADIARIIEHIDSVSLVESSDFDSARDGEFLFRVIARGDDADLARYLTLGGTLRRAASSSGGGLAFVPGWRADAAPSSRDP